MPRGRAQFTVAITCPHCGQTGTMTWEEDDGHTPGPKGRRRLVQVASGFHTEHGRTASGDAIIVCTDCDQIQAD
jgi:hypothetical protein